MMVSEANCHPFQYGKFLWMHNGEYFLSCCLLAGGIADFKKIARPLRDSLRQEVYDFLQGINMSESRFFVHHRVYSEVRHYR